MPRIITEKGLERNIGDYAHHTSKKDGTKVCGILMSNENQRRAVRASKRKIENGDTIEPRGEDSTWHEYKVKLNGKSNGLCFVMINYTELNYPLVLEE